METLKEIKRHFSKLGLMFFVGALICFGTQYVLMLIIKRLAPGILADNNLSTVISMLSLYGIGFPIMIFLVKQVDGVQIRKHKMTVGQWLSAFCIVYGLMYASNLFGVFITGIVGRLKGKAVENLVAELVSNLNPLVIILFVVILAPIFEEIIFRKMIIDRTVKYGEGSAILISALLFALFHGNLNQFAYALTIGLFFGFIYVRTGTVKYTVLMHMCINFLGSIPGMLIMKSEFYQRILLLQDDNNMQSILVLASEYFFEVLLLLGYAMFVFVLFVTGLVLFFVNLKNLHLNTSEVVIPKGRRFRTVILNLGMLLNIGYWGVQIVLQLLE